MSENDYYIERYNTLENNIKGREQEFENLYEIYKADPELKNDEEYRQVLDMMAYMILDMRKALFHLGKEIDKS